MDPLGSLELARRIWPRVVSLLLLTAVVLAPRPTAALIEGAAEARARQIISLLDRALESALKPESGHRHLHRAR